MKIITASMKKKPTNSLGIIARALEITHEFNLFDICDGELLLIESLLISSGDFFVYRAEKKNKKAVAQKVFFEGCEVRGRLNTYEKDKKVLMTACRVMPFQNLYRAICIDYDLQDTRMTTLKEGCFSAQVLVQAALEKEGLGQQTQLPCVYLDDSFEGRTEFFAKLQDSILELRCVEAEPRAIREVRCWLVAMEDALAEVIKRFGPYLAFDQQFAWALFLGDERLRYQPVLSFDDFLSLTKRFLLVDVGFYRSICFTDKEECASCSLDAFARQFLADIDEGMIASASWASLLSPELAGEFLYLDGVFTVVEANEPILSSLQMSCRQTAMGLLSLKALVHCKNIPATEVLMLRSAFLEQQRLCDYFYTNDFSAGSLLEEFIETAEINLDILQKLIQLLRTLSLEKQ
ncbi:MAG: hypothetical protein HRT88_02235 [Lentisphaeraceae bacterium]|nr:hypothetical protein [Lentisphaeraceae bacterium]